MKYGLAFIFLLAGCSNTAVLVSAGSAHVHSNVQVQGSSGLAAALGLTIIAAGAYEVARSGALFSGSASVPPEMAPDRRVNEVDCSKPVDYTLGNIRCK